MNVIIFSKNRACQLDLLLRTMELNWKTVKDNRVWVLWTATSDALAEGYRLTFDRHEWVDTMCEGNFKNDLLSVFDTAQRFSMFLVDDVVFRAPFDPDEAALLDELDRDARIACISLRLCRRINYCYSKSIKSPQPITPEGLEYMLWAWRTQVGDWSYPMSLDGNIFRTEDIHPRLMHLEYSNPNTLEDRLAGPSIDRPLMACYFDSKLFGVPLNKVQTVRPLNKSENIDADIINKSYLVGKRMSVRPYQGYENRAAHEVVAPVWEG